MSDQPFPFLGETHKIKDSTCPECGHVADGATGAGNNTTAKPGDVSLCIECACVAIFDEDLQRRKPTTDEIFMLNKDRKLQAFIRLLKQFHRERGKPSGH